MAYQYATTPWLLELADGTTRLVPTSWADITMASFARLLDEAQSPDVYGLLASVCGCTRAQVLALEPATGAQLVGLLDFLYSPAPAGWPLPAVVHVPGAPDATGAVEVRAVAVPRKLEAETFGQSVDLAQALQEYGDSLGELRRQALAIYLLPAYFGCPYDSDLLPAMLLAVDNVRLGEGLPVADFFIASLSASKRPTASSSNLYPSQLQSSGPATRNLIKFGKPTRWRRLWRAGISSKWGKYLVARWGKYLRR